MVVNQANMAQLFKGFSARFNKGFNAPVDPQDKETMRLEDFAMTVPSTSGSTDHTWIGQLPAFRQWIGSRTVNQLDLGKITVVNEPWESTVKVPVPAIEDDSYGAFGELMEAMGVNARDLWRWLAVKALLANGNWADGNPFFCKDRVLAEGCTVTNAVTTAFSAPALEAAIAAMRGRLLPGGRSANVLPKLLVVGPSNMAAARRIIHGELVANAAGTATESNPLKDIVQLRCCNDLAGDHAGKWYLFGEVAGIRAVAVQKRKEAKLTVRDSATDENVFMDNEVQYGADARGEGFLTLPFLAYAGGFGSVADFVAA
jgi:phage major head subunit gpT-like protein